jgi:predicted permease
VHLDGAPPKSNVSTEWLAVGLDFFSTMRIPLLAGRTFSPADFASAAATNAALTSATDAAAKTTRSSGLMSVNRPDAQAAPVPVIINEAFTREFFPNQDPVGKHVGNAQEDEPATGPQPGYLIVGIAGNTKYNSLRPAIEPTMYVPQVGNSAHFELRAAADPTALIPLVRGVVSRADSNLPLFAVRTQTQQIDQTLFLDRLMSQISSAFALLALVLACIGLYGLLSYEVTRRTREIGIRMALGAKAGDVLRAVIAQGIALAAVGVTIGVAIALGVTRFLGSLLYNVKAGDPLTFAGVALLLVAVAALACYIPALRAARVDPMVALRYE